MEGKIPNLKLNTGAHMPMLGLGTWNAAKNVVGTAVEHALVDSGYSHLDCASIYANEKEVGESLHSIFSANKRKREDIFITSKLWNTDHAKADVMTACKKSLQDLQIDYLDLYLMHFGVASPQGPETEPLDAQKRLVTAPISVQETWEAMEELVSAGLVKAIGVANFTTTMLVDLLTYAKMIPAVNQIELHPYNQQTRLVEFCQSKNIVVTAYSPLGSPGGMMNPKDIFLLKDPMLARIGEKYKKTPAQILLRWGIERKTIVIPKSVSPERIQENAQIFDFELSQDEMKLLAGLERHHRYVNPWDWWKLPYFE